MPGYNMTLFPSAQPPHAKETAFLLTLVDTSVMKNLYKSSKKSYPAVVLMDGYKSSKKSYPEVMLVDGTY
jgi:hypothetical protein